MHNDIIAAGSKERPPMLAPDSYAQWKSRFMRYVDTKPNRELIKKTINEGPYIMTEITHPEILEDGDRARVPCYIQKENYDNTAPENKKLIDAKVEVVHMILNRTGNDIYSIVDAFPNSKEMWIAIEHLQQGESINIQDQANNLDNVSYHTLFDILKQHQNEVNEIHAERIARNANPLALVVATQNYPDDYYKAPLTPKPYKPHTPSQHQPDQMLLPSTKVKRLSNNLHLNLSQHLKKTVMKNMLRGISRYIKVWHSLQSTSKTSTNLPTTTFGTSVKQPLGTGRRGEVGGCDVRHFAKECKKPKRVKDYEYHKEKMMLCKQESKDNPLSEVLHATDDNSGPTYDVEPLEKVHTDDDYNVFGTERQHFEQLESINDTYVVKTIDSNVIPNSSDMCDNEGNDDQNAEEPENERVLLASLIANLKLDVDEDKKIQKQLNKANTSLTQELDKYKLDLKYCKIELERNKTFQTNQKDKEAAELKCKEVLDLLACNTHKNTESLKTEACIICSKSFANPQYFKKAKWEKPCLYNVQYDKNDLTNIFAPESEETIRLAEKSRSKLGDLVKPYDYTKLNNLDDLFVSQQQKSRNLDNIRSIVETDWQQRKIDWQNPITHDIKFLVHDMLIPLAHKTLKIVGIFENALKEEMLEDLKYVKSFEKEVDDLKIDDLKSQLEHEKTDFPKVDDLLLQEFFSKDFVCVILLSLDDIDEYSEIACNYLEKNEECERLEVELSKRVTHNTSVSRPQLKSTQMKDKVMPNNSQVMIKKKKVEDHHRISSFSNKTKSVTACNDSLNAKTSNAKVFINDMNARTKKPNVMPISTRKPTRQANQSVAKPYKKTVASETTIQKSQSYFRMLYEKTSKPWTWWIEKQCPSG
ncbi:hypothetical protein Tco_0716324 [Tanacetum coccineum]